MLDAGSRVPTKNASQPKPSRYHPALVTLHWISAVLILVALVTGQFWLKATANSSPDKILLLGAHMIMGVAILLLTIARLAVRIYTPKPEQVATGSPLLDKMALATHYGLYLAVALVAVSGIATAVASGLPAIVFGGSGEPLPETFSEIQPRIAHGIFTKIIVALILLHLVGTLYHHLIRKDQLLRRIWFEPARTRNSMDRLVGRHGLTLRIDTETQETTQ
jgi:cytochrome b561